MATKRMAAAARKATTSGRPAGRKNAEYDSAEGELTRCGKCGSTDREAYFGDPIVQEFSGVDEAGRPYTHIVRRRTRCRNCGQLRIDMHKENRVPDARRKN